MTSVTRARSVATLLTIVALLIATDLVTKQWAARNLRGRPRPYSLVGTLVQLEYRENPGVIFGLFASGGARAGKRAALLAVGAVGVIALVALFVRATRAPAAPLGIVLALALALAGALGNFVDRLSRGYVVDFIVLGYRGLRWPTFNVADVAISAALVLAVVTAARRRPV